MDLITSAASSTKAFFASLSFDVLILGGLAAFFFLIGLRSGKTRLINLVFSIYLATLLLLYFPFKALISYDLGLVFGKYGIIDLILLLVVVAAVQVVVGYVLELDFDGKAVRNTINNLILSISTTFAFLAGVYLTGVVKVVKSNFSFLDALYTSDQYIFALLVLPLVGVFIVAR